MMQKSIASDEAEMRYALQTILSICSKYILYSLILTIPCSVLCNTQDTHRSRVHCTTSKVYLHTQEWCTLHHFHSAQCTHSSRAHCTTSKVYVHTQEPLQRPADIVTQTSVGEWSWPAVEAVSRYWVLMASDFNVLHKVITSITVTVTICHHYDQDLIRWVELAWYWRCFFLSQDRHLFLLIL